MDPVGGVSSVSGGNLGTSADDVALASFAAKVTAGGDIASECMALMAEDNACQANANLLGIRVQQRAVRQARKRRMELLKKQWAASGKRGFWSKLKSIFSGIAKAMGALMTFCSFPLAGPLRCGAAAASAGFSIAGGHYQRQATKIAADELVAEQYKQIAQEARDSMLQSLQDAAEVEKRMASRISALAESESKSVVLK